jgi:hypothetical protein
MSAEIDRLIDEARQWERVRDHDPYNQPARKNLAELLYRIFYQGYELGSIDQSRQILMHISASFPTPTMSAAYFQNLERLLEQRRRQLFPGQIILGLGAGRCGSTTLSHMLASFEGGCATHENPPEIYCNPEKEQLEFHFRRFRLLTKFFSLVFDASHWWLWAIDRFFKEFPDGKAIGLYRDTRACVQSFARIKGQGKGALNHWVAPGNGIWSANNWDPTYPTYEMPEHASDDPDAARAQLMTRYVEEYNHELFALAKRNRRKVMLIRTEELADPGVQENMFEFIGQRADLPSMLLNRGTLEDGSETLHL